MALVANCNHNTTVLIFYGLTMPALTIKNIPDTLYAHLKIAANQHRRSINSEVLFCLEQSLLSVKPNPAERLKRIEQLRNSIKPVNISLDDIDNAITTGRP